MMAVKVVLQDDERGEVELGTFNQGVVFERRVFDLVVWMSCAIDVASDEVIASCVNERWQAGNYYTGETYQRLFVQGV